MVHSLGLLVVQRLILDGIQCVGCIFRLLHFFGFTHFISQDSIHKKCKTCKISQYLLKEGGKQNLHIKAHPDFKHTHRRAALQYPHVHHLSRMCTQMWKTLGKSPCKGTSGFVSTSNENMWGCTVRGLRSRCIKGE